METCLRYGSQSQNIDRDFRRKNGREVAKDLECSFTLSIEDQNLGLESPELPGPLRIRFGEPKSSFFRKFAACGHVPVNVGAIGPVKDNSRRIWGSTARIEQQNR